MRAVYFAKIPIKFTIDRVLDVKKGETFFKMVEILENETCDF